MGTFRRRLTRRLAAHSYYLTKVRYLYGLHRQDQRSSDPPVLIFQMGKVGSQTVRASLEALQLDRPLYFTHYLTGPYLVASEDDRKKYFGTPKQHRLRQAWQSQYLQKRIAKDLKRGRRWKVVTLVRDPIARDISMFFQGLDFELLHPPDHYRVRSDFVDPTSPDFELEADLERPDVLIERFLDSTREDGPTSCVGFFDVQMEPIFGIDVFETPFSPSRGFHIYRGEAADVLLIRLESLNQCAPQAFKDFLDIDDFVLRNANVSENKDYAAVYRRFKESISLPRDYVSRVYSSKFMRHFYSPEEIEKFSAKWCG